jgi:peroxiredoxin
MGGRYLVLCFFATADAKGRRAIAEVLEHTDVFDDKFASFFGVSLDPRDETQRRVSARLPGYRFFWDFTGEISKLYGAIPNDDSPPTKTTPLHRMWFVIDPTLRILKIVPFEQNGGDAKEVVNFVRSLPPPALYAGFEVQAPVLILSNVFERQFCDKLIALYDNNGGSETGFMREVGGRTVETIATSVDATTQLKTEKSQSKLISASLEPSCENYSKLINTRQPLLSAI